MTNLDSDLFEGSCEKSAFSESSFTAPLNSLDFQPIPAKGSTDTRNQNQLGLPDLCLFDGRQADYDQTPIWMQSKELLIRSNKDGQELDQRSGVIGLPRLDQRIVDAQRIADPEKTSVKPVQVVSGEPERSRDALSKDKNREPAPDPVADRTGSVTVRPGDRPGTKVIETKQGTRTTAVTVDSQGNRLETRTTDADGTVVTRDHLMRTRVTVKPGQVPSYEVWNGKNYVKDFNQSADRPQQFPITKTFKGEKGSSVASKEVTYYDRYRKDGGPSCEFKIKHKNGDVVLVKNYDQGRKEISVHDARTGKVSHYMSYRGADGRQTARIPVEFTGRRSFKMERHDQGPEVGEPGRHSSSDKGVTFRASIGTKEVSSDDGRSWKIKDEKTGKETVVNGQMKYDQAGKRFYIQRPDASRYELSPHRQRRTNNRPSG